MIGKGYKRKGVDKNLFIKYLNLGSMIAQIYMDDISLIEVREYFDPKNNEFEMSMVSMLSYFFSLQGKPLENGIFISQRKYAKNLAKNFELDSAKYMRMPMSTFKIN